MMAVIISPATCQIEVREGFSLALPKFLWNILEARAKTLHQGDLQKTVEELASEMLLVWFKDASRKAVTMPAPSEN
ncbi:MAG: hypothetical protein JRI59_09355 [Deltaproteobacteria bacterium]|nr:hypothetical protein [Deltaproteobacteria bacterium]